MKRIFGLLKKIMEWIFSHKKIMFLYIPGAVGFALSAYVLMIFLTWQGNREDALKKLSRYKQLIDRTEDLRKGVSYTSGDIDLSSKVVDIPSRIYDRNNEIIGEFFEEKREIVPYDNIPEWIMKGVIASEDRDFYKHNGISYRGIFRAFAVNLIHLEVRQGGSTITQQLAKVLFTDMERNLKRKIYEAFCALEIEERYDKQDILSMYLNLIYFGKGAYGVESTAKMFFGMPVKQLNEVECAMIVATISNPLVYSPLENLNNSVRKTKRIMRSMADAGYIHPKRAEYKYKQFIKKWDVVTDENGRAVSSLIGSFVTSTYRVNSAPFFNERMRRMLVDKFGEDVLKKGGLRIYTTIDSHKQEVALASLRRGIEGQRNYHKKMAEKLKKSQRAGDELEKAKNIEGALVTLNPYTGEIISYVGGYEFSSSNQLDHAEQIKRQPGSAIKPIIYTAAVENRDITPSTVFEDADTVFDGGYNPHNYSNRYAGNIIVREALRKSVNVVAVKVLEKTGYDLIFDYFSKGLDLSKSETNKRFGKTLSLALGTYEVSPMELAVLHSMIVNGGVFIKPYGLRCVKDYNGNIVWDRESSLKKYLQEKRAAYGKIIDPVAAAVTLCMLQGVFEKGGTAYYSVYRKNIPFQIAGKTGTSTDYSDAWFAGYSSELVSSVWIGNKKGAISLGKGRSGGALCAPVWAEYTEKIYRDRKAADFHVPEEGISKERICPESGKVAGPHGECPDSFIQLYYSGSEPGEFCPLHSAR